MDDIGEGARPAVSALNKILGRKFSVLDSGFVRAVDYMGNDESIVQAARVSYGRGTSHVSQDRALIRYLMRHRHTTPFEMCELKLHVRVPMDCWRQWIRHRTANVNEYSTRYSIAIDAAQETAPNSWRLQSRTNRQGSGAFVEAAVGQRLTGREAEVQALARVVYEERIEAGVAREQARKDLPLSTYTEAYWKSDLHNLFGFLDLRMDSHAQHEIRAYANVIAAQIVAIWCPLAYEAFLDYRREAMIMSRPEREIMGALMRHDDAGALKILRQLGWLDNDSKVVTANRERDEFEAKLQQLGILAPWIAGEQ